MTQQQSEDILKIGKLDYLQGKYVFRYPYTFTSMKWGVTLGSFFALHTYIRTKNIRHSFINWIEKTVVFTFTVWAYFYGKYNFYQNSINLHEEQQDLKIQQTQFMKQYLQYKLNIPKQHNLGQQQLLNLYNEHNRNQIQKMKFLDLLLAQINSNTFDQLQKL